MKTNTAKPFAKITAGLAFAMALSAATPANASPSDEEQAFREISASLTEHLIEHDVPTETRDAILDAWRSGDLPDSMDGTAPISTTISIVNNEELTISRFPDGSVGVTTVEQPARAGSISVFGVSGCTARTSGIYSYRTNCLIDRWDGVIQQKFRADFTFVSNGYDRIDAIYNENWTVYGALSAKKEYFGIEKKNENASGPARASLKVSAQLPYIGSTTYGLGLRVGATVGGQSYSF